MPSASGAASPAAFESQHLALLGLASGSVAPSNGRFVPWDTHVSQLQKGVSLYFKPLSCHLGFSFPIGCFTLGVVPRKHVEKTTENTTNMPGLQPSFVEQPDMFSCFGHTHTQKCFACFLILHLTLMLCEITYVVSK